jgi:hypothetical protein
MVGDDIKIISRMDDMTAENIKMHLPLLIESIQENEHLYCLWCSQRF